MDVTNPEVPTSNGNKAKSIRVIPKTEKPSPGKPSFVWKERIQEELCQRSELQDQSIPSLEPGTTSLVDLGYELTDLVQYESRQRPTDSNPNSLGQTEAAVNPLLRGIARTSVSPGGEGQGLVTEGRNGPCQRSELTSPSVPGTLATEKSPGSLCRKPKGLGQHKKDQRSKTKSPCELVISLTLRSRRGYSQKTSIRVSPRSFMVGMDGSSLAGL